MKYQIVSDSVLDVDGVWFAQNDVKWVPLSFSLEGYPTIEDDFGQTIPFDRFYQELREGKKVTTSQGTPGHFAAVFEESLKQGLDIVYVGFSSGLSGSFHSACVAKQELEERYPERHIYCIDTKAAAGGHTMLVKEAVRCRQEGMPADALAEHIEQVAMKIVHVFTVDDLMYLHRGGRVSKSKAVVGSLVGIKPVLYVDREGRLIPRNNVRGRKKAIEQLGQTLADRIDPSMVDRYEISISHGDCLADAESLKQYIKEKTGIRHVFIHVLDTVIGAHAGPGTLALFFYGDARDA